MTRSHLRCGRHGAVALVMLDHPPVNSLSHPVRLALLGALESADDDSSVKAIVLAGVGRGFCAGGDLAELHLSARQAWPGLSDHIFPCIESCHKPVIAALQGFAIGGGLELALACHYRVAHVSTRIALPEVRHGIVPPSGSQLLPRAAGFAFALDLIVPGQTVPASQCADSGLFDRVCDRDVVQTALEFADALDVHRPASESLLRHRPLCSTDARAALSEWRTRLAGMREANFAMHACVDAVEFALTAPDFDAGVMWAKRLHDDLSLVG